MKRVRKQKKKSSKKRKVLQIVGMMVFSIGMLFLGGLIQKQLFSTDRVAEQVTEQKTERKEEETSSSELHTIGEPVDVSKQTYVCKKLDVELWEEDVTIGNVNATQGMTIYDGIVFQLFSNDVIILMDFESGKKIAELPIHSDHGDSIDFSNEFYEEGDEFPLAYITADTNPAKVYVVRITREETTLIRTLTFPLQDTGYYAGHCLDADNEMIYQVGYTKDTYYENENGDNYMIVSSWDLKELSENEDGTYSPQYKKAFKIPFIMTAQGQAWFQNQIVITSSHKENTETEIWFVDPFSERVTTKMTEFPEEIKNVEMEAVAFVEKDGVYDMIIKSEFQPFYEVHFK